jgi:hypothetical protein
MTVNASAHVAVAWAHLPVTVSQVEPCAQSESCWQLVLQRPVIALQAYGGHGLVPGTAHMPAPSQVPPGCEVSPMHDAAAPQGVAALGYVQAVGLPVQLPWQAPGMPQVP